MMFNYKLIQILKGEKFMSDIKRIKYNPTMEGMAEIIPDVVFSNAGGVELKMQIILPWWDRENKNLIPSYPLVVFVQGSAWTFPNVWYEVPQLCELARKGYVVATITHRNSLEGHPYPACIEDIKTAIRYLRKNAKSYGIDTEKVGIWGTSSGGNLALLTAMTIGDDRYITDEHTGYSDKVNFCVSCFPTTDFVECMKSESFDKGIKDIFVALSGGSLDEDMTVLKNMSPYHIVDECIKNNKKLQCPPIFMAHGTKDMLIPYEQSEKLYYKLKECETDVTMVAVEDAPHEGPFWSREFLDMVFEFIDKTI